MQEVTEIELKFMLLLIFFQSIVVPTMVIFFVVNLANFGLHAVLIFGLGLGVVWVLTLNNMYRYIYIAYHWTVVCRCTCKNTDSLYNM